MTDYAEMYITPEGMVVLDAIGRLRVGVVAQYFMTRGMAFAPTYDFLVKIGEWNDVEFQEFLNRLK